VDASHASIAMLGALASVSATYGMQVAMRRESSKLSLWLVAALLLVSTAAQVASTSDVTADEQKDGAPDSLAPEPEETPKFDATTLLLMWVQQNKGVVSFT